MEETASNTACILNANIAEIQLNAESAEKHKTDNKTESARIGNESKKDSSLEEDLLGANSLLMSDTDDETDNINKIKNDNQLTSVKTGELEKSELNMDNIEVEQIKITNNKCLSQKRRKKITILDSDTDESIDDVKTETQNLMNEKEKPEEMDIIDSNTGDDDDDVGVKKERQRSKFKFNAIIDSDTDEENKETDLKTGISKKPNPIKKVSALIDTDSETDHEETLKNASKLKIFDFEEGDSDNQKLLKQKKSKKLKKLKKKEKKPKESLTDSESDTQSSLSGNESNESINNEEIKDSGANDELVTKEKSKPMRASAKKAMDEMQAIQSEQQRLHREAHISIPYHKPKRHTLQEFLKRRTIIKPASDNECSPAATILRQKKLKMTTEELEEYAKLMEERAKEATEFFKSESESEQEDLKDNDGVLDMEKSPKIDTNFGLEDNSITENNSNDHFKIATNFDNETPLIQSVESMDLDTYENSLKEETKMNEESKTDLLELNDATVIEFRTQPIITEVLELPRLDLSTLHVTEDQHDDINSTSYPSITPTKVVEKPKTKIQDELFLSESPCLKGNENMLIDLESGDLIEKKSTGADNLLQRLLATHKAKKAKTNETVNILSNENGKLEMTKVNFHHHDELEVNKEQKPGAAYIKLKENLKTLIKKKRIEEMQKKQEDEDEYNKCLEGDDDDYELFDDEAYEVEKEFEKKKNNRHLKSEEMVIDDEEIAQENDIEEENDEEEDDDVDDGAEDEDEEKLDLIEHETEETDDHLKIEDDSNEIEVEEHEEDEGSSTESDDSSNDTDNESSNNDVRTFKEPLTTTQRKNRIIKAFAADSDSENDDDDDDIDLLKTQLPIVASNVITPLFGVINSPLKSNFSLGTNSSIAQDIGNTQELLELCSGSFDITQQKSETTTNNMLISQIPLTIRNSETDSTADLLALCSGSFDQEKIDIQQSQQSTISTAFRKEEVEQEENSQPKVYKIISSDDEENKTNLTQNRIKKLRKKLKKGQAKLGFSDDEDEDELTENFSDFPDKQKNENAIDLNDDDDDVPETYVEYDSEENEIIVEMTKKDCRKRAQNYVEHEAELSESEWGSADEDEKNMDNYDIELGDEDEFDGEQLQQELGKIHARKILDEDIREVRKIQEMLFEDEENDGVGRQRQFRWKNAESGFSLDEIQRVGDDGIDGNESGEEEQRQEHQWRKIRHEREQLLKEQGLKESSQEFLTTNLGGVGTGSPLTTFITNIKNLNKNITPVIKNNGKKIQIVTKKSTNSTSITNQKGSPFLISTAKKSTTKTETTATKSNIILKTLTKPTTTTTTATTTILQPKSARSSFLMRDKETLTKFANITKNIAATTTSFENDETAGTVSVKTVKAKNFVFATLTKEEHEHMKRKADDLINSSSENGVNFMKKPRTAGLTDKQCLIDKLL